MAINKKVNIALGVTGDKKAKSALGSTEQSITAMVTAGLSIYGVKKAFDATVKAAIEQEKIFKSLETQVINSGKSWGSAKAELDGMFASLQATTAYGDTESAKMLDKLIAFSGNYEKSTKNLNLALDMASTSMFDEASASRYLGMALAGNIEMLGRYVPELKSTNNELLKTMSASEKAEYAVKVLNEKFGGAAQKQLETTAGKWKKLKNYIGDVGEIAGDKTTPAIDGLLDVTTTWLQELSETTLETAVRQLQEMGIAAKDLAGLQKAVNIENAFGVVEESGEKVKKALLDVYNAYYSTAKPIGTWGDEAISMMELLGQNASVYGGQFKNLLNETSVSSKVLENEIASLVSANKELYTSEISLTKQQSKDIKETNERVGVLTRLLALVKEREGAVKALTNAEKENSDIVKPNGDRSSLEATTQLVEESIKYSAILGQTAEQLFGINGEVEKLATVTSNYVSEIDLSTPGFDAMMNYTDSIASNMAQAVIYGQDFGEAMVNSLKAIAAQLASKAAVYLLLSGLSGGTGGLATLAGAALSKFSFFADGGEPPVNRPSIVGERGPELFVPKVAGNIIPNDQLGGGVNITINGDFLGTEQQADKLAKIIVQRSKQNFNNIMVKN